jgi:hypothetical protein
MIAPIDHPGGGEWKMAETKRGKKFVVVEPYTRKDGTKVPKHDRSTPRPPKGK